MHLLILLLAYFIGAIPFGFLLVRLKTGRDVREMGSGNIGATNVLRTTSRTLGVITLALDIGKGFAAVWMGDRLGAGSANSMALAAIGVVAGHAFPVFLRFRGGKAVASFLGAFLYLTPAATAAVLIVFVAVVARTRFISLGSIAAAATFPLGVWLIAHPPSSVLAASALSSAFVIWRHKENIARLREGRENTFSFGGRKS